MTGGVLARVVVRSDPAYEVVIGRGLVDTVAPLLPSTARNVAVVAARDLPIVGEVENDLRDRGYRVGRITVPDAEPAKTVAVLDECWAQFAALGLTRTDAVVAVGGGAVTDLVGFAAGTWLRGIGFVNVPTTVLGMVDAAVGGKTGINTAAGKNLVGVFHQPLGVVVDLTTLDTLPASEITAGLAEAAKVGLTSDPRILELLFDGAATDPRGSVLPELVERAIAVKARVVGADTFERAADGIGRQVLNYGHTFAHAIEAVESYTWRHGHAVSVGLVYAAELSALAGRLAPADVEVHREVLARLGLPLSYRGDRWPALRAAMASDKKATGTGLHFVVLDAIGDPAALDAPAEELLEAAYARVST